MRTAHALEGYDRAACLMAIKAPEQAPVELLRALHEAGLERIRREVPNMMARLKTLADTMPYQVALYSKYSAPEFDEVAAYITKKTGVSASEIKSSSKKTVIMRARKQFYYLARMQTGESWAKIAKYCGGRDHTSAMCAAKKYAKDHNLPQPK